MAEEKTAEKSTKNQDFAVIETGGKQYRVSVGDILAIEKLDGDLTEGDTISFDKVLLIDKGGATQIGTPFLEGKKVEGVFKKEGKGKKIDVLRFKSKSRYEKRYGHRQPFTLVKITKVA